MKCGKPGCSRCPHGPYWYGRRDGRKVYLGKKDPRPNLAARLDWTPAANDVGQACGYLGVGLWMPHATVLRIVVGRTEAVSGPGQRSRAVRARLARAYEVVCSWQGWTPYLVREEVR